MPLTPHQKKQLNSVLILLLGMPAVVFAVYKGVQYLLIAGSDPAPREVTVSNLTTNSLTISWVTEKPVEAFVIPIKDGVEGNPVADKRGSGVREGHYVELRGLEPSTEYSLVLLSDGQRYTSGDSGKYTISTAPIGVDTPVPSPVHGSVIDSSPEDVIIYVLFSNKSVHPVSSVVPSSGNWIVDLSAFRSVDDMKIVRTTDSTQLTVIARKGPSLTDIVQGAYSELFSSDGKLNSNLSLKDSGEVIPLSYFPPESILETKEVVPQQPQPQEPEPQPQEPPQETLPTYPYSLRRDVQWIDLVGSMGGVVNLQSGEPTIMVTNLTDVGFSVIWISNIKEEGYIKYGTSITDLDREGRDVRDSLSTKEEYNAHYIETDRIDPDTTYYFEVYSGSRKYDNNGEKYSVTTLSTLTSPPPFETRSGNIINATDPSDWIIVFKIIDDDELGTSGGSAYVSTLPDSNGNWILTIGDARSEDGMSYFSFSTVDILQASILGAMETKFDFKLSQNDIQLDVTKIGQTSFSGKVGLLENYGIISVR